MQLYNEQMPQIQTETLKLPKRSDFCLFFVTFGGLENRKCSATKEFVVRQPCVKK